MINLKFPSKKTKLPLPVVYTSKRDEVGAIFKEAQRRDKIIKDMAASCPWNRNDVAMPYSIEEQDKWGKEIIVEHVVCTYAAYGKVDWPESDQPLIVQAFSVEKQARFYCTPAYLIPLEKKDAT